MYNRQKINIYMDRIEILIADNKEFGDVAFLVDKQEFLETVEKLRKKWEIRKLLPVKKFVDWKQKLYEARVIKQKEYKTALNDFPDNLSDIQIEELQDKIGRIMPDVDFDCDARDVRIKFRRPDTFDKVIEYAIVCGIIPDGIYKSTYWEIDPSTSPPQRLQDQTLRVAIYVTPQTQDKDLSKVFKEIKTSSFKDNKDTYTLFYDLESKDVSGEVKRNREWYWINHLGCKNRKGYNKIAKETGEVMETIRSGIRAYKLALNKY